MVCREHGIMLILDRHMRHAAALSPQQLGTVERDAMIGHVPAHTITYVTQRNEHTRFVGTPRRIMTHMHNIEQRCL